MHFIKRYRWLIGMIIIIGVIGSGMASPFQRSSYAQDPNQPIKIDAESDGVALDGAWESLPEARANGGSYLMSQSDAATLTLNFSGTSLDVVYVTGSRFGTLAVEIDGVVVRTIVANDPAFGYQTATFNYLSEGDHVATVYAVDGYIGIDAFVARPLPQDTAPTATPRLDLSNYYYIYEGQPIPLQVSNDWIAVKFSTTNPLTRQVALTYAAGVGDVSSDFATEGRDITLVPLRANADVPSTFSALNDLRTAPTIEWANPVFTTAGRDEQLVIGDESIVRYADGLTLDQINAVNARYGVSIIKPLYAAENTYLVKANNGAETMQITNAMAVDRDVTFAQPNFTRLIQPYFTPNDTNYLDQWHLFNNGQYSGSVNDADIDAPLAWDIEQGDSTVQIAVIDDGVQIAHPELDSKVVAAWDFVGNDSNPTPNSWDGHGTAASGIIVAETNNATGVAGVCPGCQLIPIRVFYSAYDGGDWISYDSEIGEAIDYAWEQGADVISNSWGGGSPSSYIDNAIYRAFTQGRGGLGTIVLFATGNSNTSVSYPATNPYVVAVGATNWCDQRKQPIYNACNGYEGWGGNYGPELDISAPSHSIYTTDISGSGGYTNGNYAYFNGTSSATPVAAGVFGLVVAARPDLTANAVMNFVYDSADDVNGGGWDQELGYGRINAYTAVLLATEFYVDTFNTLTTLDATYIRNPVFSWQKPSFPSDITHYQIYVTDSTGVVHHVAWYETAKICIGNTCTVQPALSLPGEFSANIYWWVQPYSTRYTSGLWSAQQTFSIAQAAPLAPSATVTSNDGKPTFIWNTTGLGETHYQLYVTNTTATYIHNQWYSNSICSGNLCSVTPSLPENVLYENQTYQWYVRTWGPQGYGPWSGSPYNFTINASAPPLPTNLTPAGTNHVDINRGNITYRWSDHPNAAYFHLVVWDGAVVYLDKWYQKGGPDGLLCNGSTCALQPGTFLPNGSYTMWVQSYGPGLYNQDNADAWASQAFSINLAPPDASKLAPIQAFNNETFGDSYDYSWLVYDWTHIDNASYYEMVLVDGNGAVVYNQGHFASAICSGSSCQLALPDYHHANGTYIWYVRAWGSGGYSINEISGWKQATYTYAMTAPAAPTTLTETNTTTNRPTFTWTLPAGTGAAMWFEVYIYNNTTATVAHQQWYQTDNCNHTAADCTLSITPELDFAPGSYTWYVHGWGPAGNSVGGPFGNGWSAAKNFTIAYTTPTTPTLNTPTSGFVSTTMSDQVTFVWTPVSNASWYEVEVKNSAGTVIYTQWIQCFAKSGTCSHTATIPFGDNHTWRMRSYNSLNGGSYSSYTASRTLTVLE